MFRFIPCLHIFLIGLFWNHGGPSPWFHVKFFTFNQYTWDKSYPECCSELNWLTLETQRDMLTCCQVYKTINHLDCITFTRYFTFSGTHTRSHSSLGCSHSRINAFRHSFFVRSPFLWNTLPFDIVSLVWRASALIKVFKVLLQ